MVSEISLKGGVSVEFFFVFFFYKGGWMIVWMGYDWMDMGFFGEFFFFLLGWYVRRWGIRGGLARRFEVFGFFFFGKDEMCDMIYLAWALNSIQDSRHRKNEGCYLMLWRFILHRYLSIHCAGYHHASSLIKDHIDSRSRKVG